VRNVEVSEGHCKGEQERDRLKLQVIIKGHRVITSLSDWDQDEKEQENYNVNSYGD